MDTQGLRLGTHSYALDVHVLLLGVHEYALGSHVQIVYAQVHGWRATRLLCAPITATCGPPKNRQLSRIGSPHPSTKFHALPQQPTRECCVVPRVLCASPRVLRACPSVPSVLCGGAYFCACTPTCVIMCAHVIGQQKSPPQRGEDFRSEVLTLRVSWLFSLTSWVSPFAPLEQPQRLACLFELRSKPPRQRSSLALARLCRECYVPCSRPHRPTWFSAR